MHYSELGREPLHPDHFIKAAMLIWPPRQVLVFALLTTAAGEEGQPVGDTSMRKHMELQHQKLVNGCSLPQGSPRRL